jgi:hypothetical protein
MRFCYAVGCRKRTTAIFSMSIPGSICIWRDRYPQTFEDQIRARLDSDIGGQANT